MENNKRKKQILISIMIVLLLIIATIGVTYTFFNYTRTGVNNNIGTGRIYFYSEQDGSLNITNAFPQKKYRIKYKYIR